jgi:hypothetical protein
LIRTVRRAIVMTCASVFVLPLLLALSAGSAEAATCAKYRVAWGPAPVHENPDTNSVVRKYKYVNQYVTGPANKNVLDTESGVWFIAVYTSAATDGEGWMRAAQLDYPTSC